MPVEFGQTSIPGQALLEVEDPSEDEDDGDEADGPGGAHRDDELREMLHGPRAAMKERPDRSRCFHTTTSSGTGRGHVTRSHASVCKFCNFAEVTKIL